MAFLVERHVQNAGRQFLIEGDANGYWELATRVAAGQDYSIYQPPRFVLRTPGFPLLLAASIKAFGNSILAARLVLAFVGMACCWMTFLLGRGWFGERCGLIAANIMAISPLHVGNSVLILSETLFALGLITCLLLLSRLVGWPTEKPSGNLVRMSFCSGVATGITVLIRPGWVLWVGVSSAIGMFCGKRSFIQQMLMITMILAGCFLALLPWAYRNHAVTGHWIFTSLWSGPSLYDGLHPNATGASDMRFVDEENIYSSKSEYEANAHYKQLAFQFAIQNKARAFQLAIIKAGRYLSPTPNAQGFSVTPVFMVSLLFYAAFFLFVIFGTWRLRQQLAAIVLLASPFLQFLLVHMVFVGSIRYRLPVEYPLSVLAAAGIEAVWDRFRNSRQSENCEETAER